MKVSKTMFKKENCFKGNYVLDSKVIQRKIMFKSPHKEGLKVQFLFTLRLQKKGLCNF